MEFQETQPEMFTKSIPVLMQCNPSRVMIYIFTIRGYRVEPLRGLGIDYSPFYKKNDTLSFLQR